jgi:hypothetical protein
MSDKQLENEGDAQQFMARYKHLLKYTENNLLYIVHDQNSRSTMRSILCNGAMILGAIV